MALSANDAAAASKAAPVIFAPVLLSDFMFSSHWILPHGLCVQDWRGPKKSFPDVCSRKRRSSQDWLIADAEKLFLNHYAMDCHGLQGAGAETLGLPHITLILL
jgi:hypothetical protein